MTVGADSTIYAAGGGALIESRNGGQSWALVELDSWFTETGDADLVNVRAEGLTDVVVEPTHSVADEMHSAIIRATKPA